MKLLSLFGAEECNSREAVDMLALEQLEKTGLEKLLREEKNNVLTEISGVARILVEGGARRPLSPV